MPPVDHVHKYVRVKPGSKIYFCEHPTCTHRDVKHVLRGKLSICNKCKEQFILDGYALKLARPRCKRCREVKHAMGPNTTSVSIPVSEGS